MDSGTKEYLLLWYIENFEYGFGKCFSPEFTPGGFEGSSFSLYIYGGRYICLKRSSHDTGRQHLSVKYKTSVTLEDGSTFESEEHKYTFKKGYAGTPSEILFKSNESIDGRNTDYFLKGPSKVCCTMWRGTGRVHSVSQCSARTRLEIERICFLHKVGHFSTLKVGDKKTVRIPSHSKSGCVFSSTLYVAKTYSGDIEIYIETLPSKSNYCHKRKKFSFLDVSGNLVECGDVNFSSFDSGKQIEKMDRNFSRDFILSKRNYYLPNDELSVLCEYIFYTGSDFKMIEETVYEIPVMAYIHKYDNALSKEHSKPAENLSTCSGALDDFKALYNEQLLTDMVLKTATKSFPAHKNVLCARSSVFRATLTNEMKEKNTNCIEVKDLDDETVQRLLLFLYSDNVEELQWESALKLYYAGDKYAIEKLKLLCSAFLVDNLRPPTASELLLLAHTHSDRCLKKLVEDFILEHEKEVFNSDEWDELSDTNPQLVIKTMQLKYKREEVGK